MTTTSLRTPWEEAQWAADHGASAANAIAYQLLARHLHEHAAEDMALLGVTRPSPPRDYWQLVTGGTYEDRKARIDAFAARHGISATFDDSTGQYKAVLSFGPVSYVAYTITQGRLTERVDAIRAGVAAMAGRRPAA